MHRIRGKSKGKGTAGGKEGRGKRRSAVSRGQETALLTLNQLGFGEEPLLLPVPIEHSDGIKDHRHYWGEERRHDCCWRTKL
ncbi:hypothetical protein GW17_00019820 [Ensete ventricosum]|nr:hypothetical protein GW17_00019820 [Ensete ventricosum]RZR93825.1 hypothetical protein BHM03_00022403 [Ensete ventricosum]